MLHPVGRSNSVKRGTVTPMILTATGLAISVLAAGLATEQGRSADRQSVRVPHQHSASQRAVERSVETAHEAHGDVERFTPLLVDLDSVPQFVTTIDPIEIEGGIAAESEGGVAGCQLMMSHSSTTDFSGGEFVVQAGFVETEIAAASFTVPSDHFPLVINLTEMIFAQQNAQVTTTTEWSLMVWEGTPQNGQLVDVFSSDGLILPHLVLGPGTTGANVQVMIDPLDPEQIVVQNNGSNTFSIGYRIDKHHNPPLSNCCFGLLPAKCCPPAPSSNAFPTTDAGTYPNGPPNNPSQNWLFARECDGSLCAAPPGWYTFTQLAAFDYQPSGAWNIRAHYTPVNCVAVNGACCFEDSCSVMSDIACENQNGMFMGEGTTCGPNACPGACCLDAETGACQNNMTEGQCMTAGGLFVGSFWTCERGGCEALVGACCVPSTGACVGGISPSVCVSAGATWMGHNTQCSQITCFPEGACCLPDGSCVGPVSPEVCEAGDGTFQGHQSQCGTVTCPQPSGACCLPNGNCIFVSNGDCTLFGGDWQGMGTNCADLSGSGQPDACEPPGVPCPGDINGDQVINGFGRPSPPDRAPDGHHRWRLA